MSIGRGQPISAAVAWVEEWQRLSLTLTNHVMGCHLHGCANLVMARTPQRALEALHQTQTGLLEHSVDTIANVTRLLRKQNAELLVRSAAHAREPNARTRLK